ncbi:hypothetical protein OAL13_00020 [bacterium]|nr:hypothetical protein [bacterium]
MKSYTLWVTYNGHELHRGTSLDAQYYAENIDDTIAGFADLNWVPTSAEIQDDDYEADHWLGINPSPQPPAEWLSKEGCKSVLVQCTVSYVFDLNDDQDFDWTKVDFGKTPDILYSGESLELLEAEQQDYVAVVGAGE